MQSTAKSTEVLPLCCFFPNRGMAVPAAHADTPEQETRSRRPQVIKRHTLPEAGQSFWAPWWLLIPVRVLLGLGLTAASAYWLVGNSFLFPGTHWALILLSAFFWGPLLHAVGLVLLVACGIPERSSPSASPSRQAGIAVRMHQARCAITAFHGEYFIIITFVHAKYAPPWPPFKLSAFSSTLLFSAPRFAFGSCTYGSACSRQLVMSSAPRKGRKVDTSQR